MSLFKKFKENKKISLFVLTKRDNPDRFLCISIDKQDVIQYAYALLKLEYNDHFQSWCTLRNYDAQSAEAWDEYVQNCIDPYRKSEYLVTNVTYKLRDVVAIMRMFGGCAPMGCGFETDVEYMHAKSKKELLECQIEFERFWREHHQEEIEEALNGSK